MERNSRPEATAPSAGGAPQYPAPAGVKPQPSAQPAYGAPQQPYAAYPGYPAPPPAKGSSVGLVVVIVVVAIVALILIGIVLAAVLYVWASSFDDGEEWAPIATLYAEKNSDGAYDIQVVKVSAKKDIESFNFFLKSDSGMTHTYGEIALQNISGEVQGVESEDSWDDKYPHGDADLAARAYDVEHENDTCEQDRETDGLFPVVFYDNDRDGKLSSGDRFIVRGVDYSDDYEADENWHFELQYDPTGDVVGSERLP